MAADPLTARIKAERWETYKQRPAGRRGAMDDGDRGVPVVCVCVVARPSSGWGNGCRVCGRPVVAFMAPAAQEAIARKDPGRAEQKVGRIPPTPGEAA